ncbi:MAG: hypothetical protein V4451_00940 [Pseudomonadota bacterium]
MGIRLKAISGGLELLGLIYSIKLLVYRDLADLIASFRSARSTGVSSADFIALYSHVIARKPKFILELGAGQSSAVIALGAKKYGGARRFLAVEESAEWLAHHRETIPPTLISDMDLVQVNTEATEQYGVRAARYVGLPTLPYELVHIDGPDHDKVGSKISCDIVDLLPHLAPSCLVVFDGRESTARFSRPYLERAGFRLRRHPFTLSHEFVR